MAKPKRARERGEREPEDEKRMREDEREVLLTRGGCMGA
jgi:hypothetical protein